MEREGKYKEPIFGFEDKILDELFREAAPMIVANKKLRLVNFLFDQFMIGIPSGICFTDHH